ncbi:hypothetical protein [Bauldia litoralis]|uniref:hypothetical protein n=1 Tax=Bauldia litoralis TaxID=665467 RepID=UPI003266B468
MLSLNFSAADLASGFLSSMGRSDSPVHYWGDVRASVWQHQEHFPIRDTTFLDGKDISLSIYPDTEHLDRLTLVGGLDKKKKDWDVLAPDTNLSYLLLREFDNIVSIYLIMCENKFAFFVEAYNRHFPKNDVFFDIICDFYGFREDDTEPMISSEEFHAGEYHFQRVGFSLVVSNKQRPFD